MISRMLFLPAAAILFSCPVLAEDAEKEELERQQAFRTGLQEIVDDLNGGSSDEFIDSIDRRDIVDRFFGLRLIDQRIKKKFREDLVFQFVNIITSTFSDSKGEIKATLLGVESRGDRGRAVVRFDLPDLQFSYHEYDLRLDKKNRVIVIDWIDFLRGQRFTDEVGMTLIMAAPSKQAARKLIDFQNVRDSDLFQFIELLKAARDRKANRFIEIINGLDERLQRQRVVVLTGVQLTKRVRNRRMMRTALIQMAKYYPEEPLYSLMLLDYYFPARKYDDAFRALQRLYDRLDVEDAAMEARLSAAALVMGNPQDAIAFADKSLRLEPSLELAWWSTLRARAALPDYAGAVAALQRLEGEFGHSLGPEGLERDPGLSALLASDEYKAWLATRQ